MADPNSKRAKLDKPDTQSSISTILQNVKNQVKLIYKDSHHFEDIRKMPGFVDHTHFLKIFIEDIKRLAIFAPRRFGKSSHLNMVRKFLEIDVDKTTGEVCSSVNGPAENRKNYKLFEGTRIMENKNLVEEHLGKHPVIHLDLKGAYASSVEDARDFCRTVMHNAYSDHEYLENSTKLVPASKERNATCQKICKKWCDQNDYMTQKLQHLHNSLANLTSFLYNHFDRTKVYILVDEFDTINTNALHEIPINIRGEERIQELKKICKILENILGPVGKGDQSHDHVAGVLFTGISYVSGLGFSSLFNNFTKFKFLNSTIISGNDTEFVPFYGATEGEVKNLIEKLVKDKALKNFEGKTEFLNACSNELNVKKIMDDVRDRYNGYFDKNGVRIFCLWSVLQYLEYGIADPYWKQTDGIIDLYKILKCEQVASKVMKLMRGDTIEFKRLDQIQISSLVHLGEIMVLENKNKIEFNVVFNFLIDQGFLTYPPEGCKNEKIQEFKIPNEEVRETFSEMIENIVLKHWEIAEDTIKACTVPIDTITLSLLNNEEKLQNKMREVYQAISSLLKELGQTNREYLNESIMLCTMFQALKGAESFRLCIDLKIKDEEGKLITQHRPDFLMLKNDKKCSILWELKYNKDYKNKCSTSLHALQEARGLVRTKNNMLKNYMKPLEEDLEQKVLVIGLSMDSNTEVSLSYAVGMEEKIFYGSKNESIIFPDFYQTHNAMPLLQQ